MGRKLKTIDGRRECTRCKVAKPISEFYTNKEGRVCSCRCKECDKGRFRLPPEEKEARRARRLSSGLNNIDRYLRTPRGKLVSLLSGARNRSKKSGLDFDLDIEWLLERWERIGAKCEVTGMPMTLHRNPGEVQKFIPLNPSLDRIRGGGGYTKDNVRIVCVMVNVAMNHFGEEIFSKMCHAYVAKKTTGETA